MTTFNSEVHSISYKKNEIYLCKDLLTNQIEEYVIIEIHQKSKLIKITDLKDLLFFNSIFGYYASSKWIDVIEFHKMVRAKIGRLEEKGFWIFKYNKIIRY